MATDTEKTRGVFRFAGYINPLNDDASRVQEFQRNLRLNSPETQFFFFLARASNTRANLALVGQRSFLRLREISKLGNRISKREKWLERDKWQCRVFGKISETRY